MTLPSNAQPNDDDLELLSAYIDSRLDERERAALEERLRREPALQAVLAELRATVALLGELEQLAPPRSFALDPAAFRPKRNPLLGWVGLGSAAVAVLLAFTFVATLFNGRAGAPSAAAPASLDQGPAGGAVATRTAPLAALSVPTPTPEMAAAAGALEATAAPATGAAAPAAGAAITPASQAPTLAPQATETLREAAPGTDQSGITANQPVTALATAAGAPPVQPTEQPGGPPALAQQPPLATSGSTASGTIDLPEPRPVPPANPSSGNLLRLVAIGAGALVALLLAVWALRVWRR